MSAHTKFIASMVVAGLVCLPAVLRAHEYTYKGVVVDAAPTRVSITYVDEKTKKDTPIAFEIDKDTKILRGDDLVTFANAKIRKGEQIAITVNNDDGGGDYALVVRLAAKK